MSSWGIKLATFRFPSQTTKTYKYKNDHLRNQTSNPSIATTYYKNSTTSKNSSAKTSSSGMKPATFRFPYQTAITQKCKNDEIGNQTSNLWITIVSATIQLQQLLARASTLQPFNYFVQLQYIHYTNSQKLLFTVRVPTITFLSIFRHVEFEAYYCYLEIKLPLCYSSLIGTIKLKT